MSDYSRDNTDRSQSTTSSQAPTGQSPPPPEEDTISLLDLILVLARYKWMIVGITFLAAIGVLAYSIGSLVLPPEQSYLPNVYRPSARLLVRQDSSSGGLSAAISSSGLGGLAGLAGVDAGGRNNGQLAISLLQGRTILDQMIEEFDLVERWEIEENVRARTRAALKERSSFEYESETSTLNISYEDIDPEFARDIVNRFVELLNERFNTIAGSRATTRRDLLEEKIADVESQIVVLEERIKEFQQKHGIINVESVATEQTQTMANLRSNLILTEMEIQTYSQFARVDDPRLRQLRAERDNLRQLLIEMQQGYTDFEGVLPSQAQLPELAFQYERLQRDLQVQARIYQNLVGEFELAKLNAEGQEPLLQILETAEAPDQKAGPSRGMISIITTITAFFLAIFLAFIRAYFSNVQNDPEEGEKLQAIKQSLSLRRHSGS